MPDITHYAGRRMTMAKIYRRTISHTSKSVGPKHDPYHRDIYTITINKKKVELIECALAGTLLYVNGKDYTSKLPWKHYRRDADGKIVYLKDHEQPKEIVTIHRFEKITGLRIKNLRDIYDRLHPYFEDPMGEPWMYE
jgi:hypothetical protein